MDAAGELGSSAAAGGMPSSRNGQPAEFGRSAGFLLSQLGYAVTRRFAAALETLSLEPRHFGLLRAISAGGRPSQQGLAELLHLPASSVVALVDSLEGKGLVRRGFDPSDRRLRLVELTPAGARALASAGKIALGLEKDLCGGFSADEREDLIARLETLATNLHLTLGTHPAAQDAAKKAPPGAMRCG